VPRLRDGQREAVVVGREHPGLRKPERLDDLGVALEHGDGRGAGRQPEGRLPGHRGACGDRGGKCLDASGDGRGQRRARGPPEPVGRDRHAQHLGLELGQSFAAGSRRGDHRHAELAGERLDVDVAVVAAGLVREVHGDDHAETEVQKLQWQVPAAAPIRGGDDPRRSELLGALQRDFGAAKGRSIWDDLREANDPETPVSVPGRFPYALPSADAPGGVVLEPGSVTAAPTPPAGAMSNAILIGAKRSATGHPIFVAGPQVGYFFPQFFLEADLHGGGFDTRGVIFPGVPFVVIGRGLDFVWSATSSRADNIDVFAETLCGGDDAHYLFRGECRAMTVFNAGELVRFDERAPLRFRETVHGPVIGYATARGGARVALALQRSTRGRELRSARAFYALDTNRVTSARGFLKTMSGIEFSFDWFYADNRDIAMFSSGRLPVRAPGTDPSLPTVGTGGFEWRGFLTAAQHAQGVTPPSGAIVNWNNKPAADVGSADENWAYGSVQRVQLLNAGVAARRKHTVASVASLMNKAATQDLRAVALVPTLAQVLQGSAPTSPRVQHMLELLQAWAAAGASRLDRNGDGTVDDPGAAIMDAAYPAIADNVMRPVLGPDLGLLRSLEDASDDANIQGSSYLDGWYGYIDKDLRTLLAKPVRGAFANRYCGAGNLAECQRSLWSALEAAGAELAAKQGLDPAAWRADATAERIHFTSGILPDTMRWTNRPTFQQIFSFRTHRPR